MDKTPHDDILTTLEEIFGSRAARSAAIEGDAAAPLATVSPTNAQEVEQLAEVAARHHTPLFAQGAGTGPRADSLGGSILVRFDLMRKVTMPESDGLWLEAEAGATLLELEDNLRIEGVGLAVYPTSAPRATVGGWVAQDGLGVGSFEYGWLHENVLSADVVMPDSERREVPGEELRSVGANDGAWAIVVGAKLRTRRANDVLFGAAFGTADDLSGAVASLIEARPPLWHLAFLNPAMTRARALSEQHTLFGAYPAERAREADGGLREVLVSHHGRALPAAETPRVWGERFFPVAPSHPTPSPARELIEYANLKEWLAESEHRSSDLAIQGTVARSGEVLLLAFDARGEGWT